MNDQKKTPVMNDRLSFDDAFRFARATGSDQFFWRGSLYTTLRRHEVEQAEEVQPHERIVAWC